MALRGGSYLVLTALAALSCSDVRLAPSTLAETRSPIVGGTAVPGAWPNVVSLEGQCTAVLLSPELLVYTGHCGTGFTSIWLGDDLDAEIGVDGAGNPTVLRKSGGPSAAIDHCSVHPQAGIGTGWDAAYCVLAEPLTGIDFVAPIEGCELDAVGEGTATTLVGYGFANAEDASTLGVKRAVNTPIVDIADETTIGAPDAGTCRGDSGGPAFVRVDGPGGHEWRLFGLLSSGPVRQCGLGYYTEVSRLVGWLEDETGLDLSPCFSKSAKWAPTPACTDSTLDANGVPSASLDDSPHYAATCGRPYDPSAPPEKGASSLDGGAGPRASGCSLVAPLPSGSPGDAARLTALALALAVGLRRLRTRP